MDEIKICAALSKNSGREILKFLQEKGENLTDVFVTHENYAIKGSGFKTFDDLVTSGERIKLHKIHRLEDHVKDIKKINPDLFIMNFSEILKEDILRIPRRGVVGFHYAKLPERRGCNPASWSILHGLNEEAVTLHFYNENIDRGDIIGIQKFLISKDDYLKDVLGKIEKSNINLLKKYLGSLKEGTASRIKQIGPSIYTPRLTPEDALIVWGRMTSDQAYRTIRAFSFPFNGAYTMAGSKGKKERLYILRGEVVRDKDLIDKNNIINWKIPREEVHQMVCEGRGYTLTGNSILKITETRVGEIQE